MNTQLITASDIYWISRLDNLQILFKLIAIISTSGITLLVIIWIFCSTCEDIPKQINTYKKLFKTVSWIPVLFSFLAALTPTTKEMCAIIAIPKIANNEDVQGLGVDIVDLARDWIKELKPKEIVK